MDNQNQQGMLEVVADKIWKFFSSVKLAVVLLIILAVVSVIGTVIQQNQAPEDYLKEYSLATMQVFETLGFFDLYHTWWFVLLLLLLTANLTICTLERFPYAWKAMRAPLKPLEEDGFKAVPFKKEIMLKGGMEAAETAALKALHGKRYSHQLTKEQGTTRLASQKGAYSRMGVYVTHLSIILIFTGALTGAFFGFKGFLNLPEGEASDRVYLRNEPLWDKIMAGFGISQSPVIHDPRGGVPAMPLGFWVRTDDFEVDYYSNAGRPTGMPSEYWSILSVYDQQKQKVLQKRIRVNDPLSHDGITFYQSSYGPAGVYHFSVTPRKGGAPVHIDARQGERVQMPDGGYMQVLEAVPDVSPFMPQMSGAAAKIEAASPGGVPQQFIVFKNYPRFDEQRGGNLIIAFEGMEEKNFTGLQVAKDPGVWVVWLGCTLMVIGICMAFFLSHKRIWIRVAHKKVTMGGTASKNPAGFQLLFDDLVEKLKKQ